MQFPHKSKVVHHALTGAPYQLQPVDAVEATPQQLSQITAICNEYRVYSWLFKDRFSGQPYPSSSAADWLSWGIQGWHDGSHFVFVVLDHSGLVVAACDIKDANPDLAEIGYWSSIHHRGIMTNAVRAMVELGKEAGFRRFFAEAHRENVRSQAVLKRTGFVLSDLSPRKPEHLIYLRETDTGHPASLNP